MYQSHPASIGWWWSSRAHPTERLKLPSEFFTAVDKMCAHLQWSLTLQCSQTQSKSQLLMPLSPTPNHLKTSVVQMASSFINLLPILTLSPSLSSLFPSFPPQVFPKYLLFIRCSSACWEERERRTKTVIPWYLHSSWQKKVVEQFKQTHEIILKNSKYE